MSNINMNYSVVLNSITKIRIDVPSNYQGEHPYTFESNGVIYGFRVFENNVAYATIADGKTIKVIATHKIEKLDESTARIHFPRK